MIKTPLSTVIGGAFWTPGATIIGSSSKNLTQLIKSLFGLGEQGFAYDPNDLTTLYQDEAGTIPVTAAGQPVGLMLDKSKGLVFGNEAVVGGNFESGLVGTLVTNALSAGTLTLNTVSPISGTQDARVTVTTVDGLSPQLRFNRNVPRMVGALYEFSFDYKVISGTPYIAQIYNGSGTSSVTKALQGSGRFSARYMAYAVGTSFDQLYFSTNTFDMQIDNVSVKELAGNHAYQSVSASRPILRDTPRRIDFDTVDDKLITALPAQLTGCTVIRSIPNVGTRILTGQTIPAPYNDNIDNCGLIVINRALTASETSQITKLFNKAAGV